MNQHTMPDAMRAIVTDGPVIGRHVAEIEILETEHGIVVEALVRGHTWRSEPIHDVGHSLHSVLAEMGFELAEEIERREGRQ